MLKIQVQLNLEKVPRSFSKTINISVERKVSDLVDETIKWLDEQVPHLMQLCRSFDKSAKEKKFK